MKIFKVKHVFAILIASLSMVSCLKKGDMNIDPEKTTGTIMELQFLKNGNNTINSGLAYFSGAALTYPGTDLADTANYNISLAGPVTLGQDLTVSVGVDATKLLDNFSADSIGYELMPDSLYHFVETTATIKAGQTIAPMQIIFYPSKIDITKSYMLPVVVKDAQGKTVSSNFGTIYFHAIGNPLAGSYKWDFIRYNNQAGTGTPAGQSFSGETTVFSPSNPTSIKVPTGYYVQPDYLITFRNVGGVLSNFKAVIAPDEIDAAFTANGIAVIAGPTIDVSSDYKKITIKYLVYNGSAYRNITDIYYK
jgi:hypothetical protein